MYVVYIYALYFNCTMYADLGLLYTSPTVVLLGGGIEAKKKFFYPIFQFNPSICPILSSPIHACMHSVYSTICTYSTCMYPCMQ